MLPPPEEYQILIVDDNEMNREIMLRHLRRQGYRQIESSDSGLKALDLIAEQNFDLILLDVMMPEMNGYEVLEKIKSKSESQNIPVIMISAMDETESVVRCIELGAEDYLTKPFDPMLLKARVGVCLERKRTADQQRTHVESVEANNAQLKSLSRQNPLTGLMNRRVMDEVLPQAWAQNLTKPFSVAALTIDYFREYREKSGFVNADRCLIEVSESLNSTLDGLYSLIHYLGEYFILILPNTDRVGAIAVAKKMQSTLEKAKFLHPCSQVGNYVTISVGISTTIAKVEGNPLDLVSQSDRAMYLAKNNGCNRIEAIDLET